MLHVPEDKRITRGPIPELNSDSSYGNNGAFIIPWLTFQLLAIASDGGGWEHVSVSIRKNRMPPTWQMMCVIKDMFWDPEDCVIQYHPPASAYVNNHSGCLHLWRYMYGGFPLPPTWMVGVRP